MSIRNPLLGTAVHVGEHVAAITCVTAVDWTCKAFLDKFGQDVHQWPIIVYVILGAVIYAAGLFSARLIRKALFGVRFKETKQTRTAAIPALIPRHVEPSAVTPVSLEPSPPPPDDQVILLMASGKSFADAARAAAELLGAVWLHAPPS
jgi:hypothetical protein